MARGGAVSARLRAECMEAVTRLLDEGDELAAALAVVSKAIRADLAIVREATAKARAAAKGAEGMQRVIPGTEVPQPERDPLVARILALVRAPALVHPDSLVGTREEAIEHYRARGKE